MPAATFFHPEYPLASRYFERDGLRMHYLDEGPRDGEPVVMMHGNPTWSFYYRRLILALRQNFRCLAADHIGMGLSDKPLDSQYRYTLAQRVADLEAWLNETTDDRPITLVVHDWGGMIGLAYATRHPERISRLVVLNTAAFPLPAGKRLPWQLRACRAPGIGSLLVRGLNLFCRGAARFCARRPLPNEVRRGYLWPYDSWSNRRAVLRFIEDIPLTDADAAMRVVKETAAGLSRLADRPMLIGWGMHDFVFDRSFLDEWIERFPGAQVHRFHDAGHYVLEDAGETLIPIIEQFVRPNIESAGETKSAGKAAGEAVGGESFRRPNIQAIGERNGLARSANIAAELVAMARRQPNQAAVICPMGRDRRGEPRYEQLTFRQLDDESDRIARGLLQLGVTPGTRTVLMVPPGLDFFKLVFALFKVGAVMVCVDPGIGRANLKQCLAEAEPAAFIGVPKAHLARRLFGWGRATNRINVVVSGAGWLWGGVSLDSVGCSVSTAQNPTVLTEHPTDLPWIHCRRDDTAAILFTSGSTGPPKGAIYTHGNFQAQVAALKQLYGIQPGEIDLATFPLFALYAPALGMTAVVPEMDFTRPGEVDPRRIVEAIERFGVTNLFGSPALLDRLATWGESVHHRDGPGGSPRFSTLKRVVSAGAPVPARVIERLARLLPSGTQIFTPYGATESLPVASIGSDEILGDTRTGTDAGRGVCVGRPVGAIRVRIIAIRDTAIEKWRDDLALPTGQIGEIVVQGPAVSQAYYGRDETTALAKIADPTATHLPPEQRLWHRMGDVGYFDEQGRLWFCGRKSQRVVTADGERFTICCEGVFNAHPQVRRTALVRLSDNGATRPALCVELLPESRSTNEDKVRRELLALGADHAHTRDIRDIVFHPHFPVDIRHNAKVDREKLGAWASRRVRH
jgi:acyl-CoA synthetase (AMP-forming)/AMP-acid ligase II/pimeloyl-ACP methyl ester carboxylesterase